MSSSKVSWIVGITLVAVIAIAVIVALLFAVRPTTVPDVRLKPTADAVVLLEQAGLTLGAQSKVATSAVGAGRIAAQRPAPSDRAPRRSSVDVTVAVAPSPADIPDVVGLEQSAGVATLTEALYTPILVDFFGAETPVGSVLDQAPAAGTSWITGRPVALGIAAGPDDGTGVKVPDLKGQFLDDAMAKLGAADLGGTGFVTQLSSPESNVVVDQLPEGGVVVRPGTTVLLLLRAP